MFKLIKSQIEYFKWFYILSIALVVFINVKLTISNQWIEVQNDFPGLRTTWFAIGIIVMVFPLLFDRKSGRLRNSMLLPLTQLQISLSRIFIFIFFWSILVVILVTAYLINFGVLPDSIWVIDLLNTTGVIFLFSSIPLLNSDFYNTYFSKSKKTVMKFFWLVFGVVYILLFTIFSEHFDFISSVFFSEARKTLIDLYFSNNTAILNVLFGVGIFFLSVLTFKKRKLYLE